MRVIVQFDVFPVNGIDFAVLDKAPEVAHLMTVRRGIVEPFLSDVVVSVCRVFRLFRRIGDNNVLRRFPRFFQPEPGDLLPALAALKARGPQEIALAFVPFGDLRRGAGCVLPRGIALFQLPGAQRHILLCLLL